MSEQKRVKTTSVLAFLFMPQFRQSFEGFSHIYPIFIRVLAMMFAQSGLIPNNHPATRYGIEGVEKYGFRRLMGEAWFTLRTTRATTYQWGMFGSVVTMMGVMIVAIGTFFLNIAFGVGTAAHAQIFDHPENPYNAGTGVTDLEAIGAAPANALFDMRTSGTGVSTDYALMVLDKALRQGAMGVGGSLQDGLGAIMEVYNTGVLVVAAIIIFWMILSVVVDTAKTGVVGGGRHNMVWAPIRIVFALGLMIPLGSVGFSSGQFMVMKLAEWGSNFATRGWTAYVASVTGSTNMLVPFTMDNVSSSAAGITKVLTCQAAYNMWVVQTGTGNYVRSIVDNNEDLGRRSVRYTNGLTPNTCGRITFDYDSAADDSYIERTWSNVASAVTQVVVATNPGIQFIAQANGFTPMNRAIADFKIEMRGAFTGLLVDGASGSPGTEGPIMLAARDIACAYASGLYSDGTPVGDPGIHPSSDPNSGCNGRRFAAGAVEGGTPDRAFAEGLSRQIALALNAAYSRARPHLNNYVNNNLELEMRARGWGGMGGFLYQISVLNGVLSTIKKSNIEVIGGSSWRPECDTAGNDDCDPSKVSIRVLETLDGYDDWWANAADLAIENQGVTDLNVDTRASQLERSAADASEGLVDVAKSSSNKGDEFVTASLNQVLGDDKSKFFLFDAVDLSQTDTFPFAQLAHTGHSLIAVGTSLWGAISILQVLSSLSILGNSAGAGFALNTVMNTGATIGTVLTICGMTLAFYLPALPLIKVALAVLTWVISVFEAVCMVPIAALAHLNTEGEGLAGGARTCWILWLNVLLRPMLVVLGFIGAVLCYNAFAVFWHISFLQGAKGLSEGHQPMIALMAKVAYSIIYVSVLYTAANTTFKMLDLIPNALMRWMGGSPDQSFDDNQSEGMMIAGTQMLSRMQPGFNAGAKFSDKANSTNTTTGTTNTT